MNRQNYYRQHWQDYCLRKRRVTVTLDLDEVDALLFRAAGKRSPGQQLWLESLAYRQQRYLPPAVIENRLQTLQQSICRLHQALSAHQTSILGNLPCVPDAMRGLRDLHKALDQFLLRSNRG